MKKDHRDSPFDHFAGGGASPCRPRPKPSACSTYVNEIDVRHEGFQYFADLVAERTDGEVEIQIFPSSTLHGWSEGVDALQGGVSDISWIPADERLPCYRVTSLYPAMVDLENQVAMDAAYADLIRAEAAEVGLVPLFNSNYSYDQGMVVRRTHRRSGRPSGSAGALHRAAGFHDDRDLGRVARLRGAERGIPVRRAWRRGRASTWAWPPIPAGSSGT